MAYISRLIFAMAACFAIALTACTSEIDDNQSEITAVGPDGKVSVEGAVLKNNAGYTNSYSGYLSGIGPLPNEKREYFVKWLAENVEMGFVCSAILEDGSLSILYLNKENKTSVLESDFLQRLQQFPQSSKAN